MVRLRGAGWPIRDEAGAIADAFAGLDRTHLQNRSLQAGDGPDARVVALAGPAAIEGDAGAHQVEVVVRSHEHPGGVGEASACAGEPVAYGAEAIQLEAVQRLVRIAGAGEVAHQQPDVEALQVLSSQGAGVFGPQAQPVHPGVDVEGDLQPATIAGEAGSVPDLLDAVEDRRQPQRRQPRA